MPSLHLFAAMFSLACPDMAGGLAVFVKSGPP